MANSSYPISRDAMPIAQLQLRGMGEVVSHAVMLHAEEIAGVAQEAVKEAIRTFDWRARIAGDVQQAIERKIKSGIDEFLWSDQGRSLIQNAIAAAIGAAFGGKGEDV